MGGRLLGKAREQPRERFIQRFKTQWRAIQYEKVRQFNYAILCTTLYMYYPVFTTLYTHACIYAGKHTINTSSQRSVGDKDL